MVLSLTKWLFCGFPIQQSLTWLTLFQVFSSFLIKLTTLDIILLSQLSHKIANSIYDELRQGPGPDLGPRLNGYGDRTIMGTGHYGDRPLSGPGLSWPATRGAVPKMIPPVPKREKRSRKWYHRSLNERSSPDFFKIHPTIHLSTMCVHLMYNLLEAY